MNWQQICDDSDDLWISMIMMFWVSAGLALKPTERLASTDEWSKLPAALRGIRSINSMHVYICVYIYIYIIIIIIIILYYTIIYYTII